MDRQRHDRKEARTGNRRLAQWRESWLLEHSTSLQLLWCIDSFVLRNPPTAASAKPLPAILRNKQTKQQNQKICNFAGNDRQMQALLAEKLTSKQTKSPLNYIGGKYKLLEQILPLFPKEISTFVDLFAGGCNA